VLLWALGGLIVVGALCCGGLGAILPSAQLQAEQRAQFQKIESELGFSLTALLVGMAIGLLVLGLITLVMGFVARGGTLGRVIAALVFNCIVVLVLAFFIVMGVVTGGGPGSKGGVDMIVGICVWLVPLALYVLALVWLIQAARNASSVAAMQAEGQAMYQAQYWQYQQGQQGYGYGQPSGAPQPQQAAPSSDAPGKPGG
jgi:hypothetical protein